MKIKKLLLLLPLGAVIIFGVEKSFGVTNTPPTSATLFIVKTNFSGQSSFFVTVQGNVGAKHVIEVSNSIASTNWTPIVTNTANSFGNDFYQGAIDKKLTNGFYIRVRSI